MATLVGLLLLAVSYWSAMSFMVYLVRGNHGLTPRAEADKGILWNLGAMLLCGGSGVLLLVG